MERHREAMRALMQPDRETLEGLREEIRALVENGAEREEIAALIKEKVGEKALAKATAIAAELVTHHENMAAIFKHEGVAAKIAEGIVERLSHFLAQRRGRGPGGPGGPPRRRGGPDGPPDEGDRPENF
jgi:hypothetical protein